jgi:nucleotide-binding universal stress UspA family protein
MPMRVLVATDGSADASNAIEWLTHFPLPADTSVDVVSVIPRPVFDETVVPTAWSELRAETERGLEEARRRLAKRWPAATGHVLYGDPRQAIADAASRGGVDLVVLGARGLGAVTSFLVGSVSLGVARHAPCAVLVCKGPARPVRTVTIAIDGSPDAGAAFKFFCSLPLPRDLTARVIGVVQPLGRYPSSAPDIVRPALVTALKQYEDGLRQELERPLGNAADVLRPRVKDVISTTPVGLPADVVVRDAETNQADLIVVGARGLGPLKRMLLGSVSESVLGHAGCPVLIARHPE